MPSDCDPLDKILHSLAFDPMNEGKKKVTNYRMLSFHRRVNEKH